MEGEIGTAACVDTDVLIDYLRGVEKAREFFLAVGLYGLLTVSVVSIAEIYAGNDTLEPEKHLLVDAFLANFSPISIDPLIAKMAGEIRRDFGVPFADALVAASALHYTLPLYTRNTKHFSRIKGLLALKPY